MPDFGARWAAPAGQCEMISAGIGVMLGLGVGAGCRWFDIPSPAPPRLIGAALLLAMTCGFVLADAMLPPGINLVQFDGVPE